MAWWKSATAKWRKWQDLGRPERLLLVQAVLLLPLTRVALRLLGLRRWQAALARLAPRPQNPAGRARAAEGQRAEATARMVQAAARQRLCRASCLPQALVVWWLLRRQGIVGDLRIGVRRQNGRLAGHAWVEHDGRPLNDREENCRLFTLFDRVIFPWHEEDRDPAAAGGPGGGRLAQTG